MNEIFIKYNDKEVNAVLLAQFDMVDNEMISVKGLLGRIKHIFSPVKRQYCLVYIPWKHQEKELALVCLNDVITFDKLIGDDVISIESYISDFTKEEPYYTEYKISDFVGYKFIYDYRSFVADVKNQCFTKPLEILYQHYPQLLKI